MSVQNRTPDHLLVDDRGRPYFLWDSDMTLETFRTHVTSDDDEIRAYYVGKLMRQAKPDDVFAFVDARTVRRLWSRIAPHLGQRRAMWEWLFEEWARLDGAAGDR